MIEVEVYRKQFGSVDVRTSGLISLKLETIHSLFALVFIRRYKNGAVSRCKGNNVVARLFVALIRNYPQL